MCTIVSEERKAWVLYQFRSATFHQLENWNALYEIERLIDGEGGAFTVVERFSELEYSFSRRSLVAPDVDLFLSGLLTYDSPKRKFEAVLSPEIKSELLTQLRKMNWTQQELNRITLKLAHAIERNPDWIRSEFYHLATTADSTDEITMQNVTDFIVATARAHQGIRAN
jgi:hypothetical protein